ncbi:predicted protein [Uncinocarpus reesii 1704]|uniref:Uncharacterized protein n=1 Tax=Uncinocarpus reesii (strain UAMH 1704) TaxID=336963 RepID=C4JGL1_UNCRE|nr:uncharacterized protein UREG_01202 [Uncinocarpus reesii 1704]EEP76353.1 predicted protein [Uncinocarpus reesii 1704]
MTRWSVNDRPLHLRDSPPPELLRITRILPTLATDLERVEFSNMIACKLGWFLALENEEMISTRIWRTNVNSRAQSIKLASPISRLAPRSLFILIRGAFIVICMMAPARPKEEALANLSRKLAGDERQDRGEAARPEGYLAMKDCAPMPRNLQETALEL